MSTFGRQLKNEVKNKETNLDRRHSVGSVANINLNLQFGKNLSY